MSTQRITSSRRKLDAWAAVRELDRQAKQIAEERGITLVEAYTLTACTADSLGFSLSQIAKLQVP